MDVWRLILINVYYRVLLCIWEVRLKIVFEDDLEMYFYIKKMDRDFVVENE